MNLPVSTSSSNTSPWSAFASLVFSNDEEKRRHTFLSRNAMLFLSSAEVPVVASRICQSAIPEVADLCLVALTEAEGNLGPLSLAYRFAEEAEAAQCIRTSTSLDDLLLFFEQTAGEQCRTLNGTELNQLTALLPGDLRFSSALLSKIGHGERPLGYALFFLTASDRQHSEAKERLARELLHYGEHAILRARTAEFLRREVQAREKLISIASHELKTPLTAAMLQLDSLRRLASEREEALTPEKLEHSFAQMDRMLRKMADSIGMLFNLSEIQSGQLTLMKKPGNLADLLRDVLTTMDTLLAHGRCKVVADIPAEVRGCFDARRIEQAVTNLLANSAKYAPGCEVHLALEVENDRAKVIVGDSGPGIPPEDHSRIFEAFRRSSDRPVEGLGLGLFVARSAAQAHGGSLSLISVPGEGARFLLEFPLQQS